MKQVIGLLLIDAEEGFLLLAIGLIGLAAAGAVSLFRPVIVWAGQMVQALAGSRSRRGHQA